MGEILTALKECIVRFFDRLFQDHPNEEFEFLRSQLEAERYRADKLIEKLTEKPANVAVPEVTGDLKPISGYMPWHVRKQMLEKSSREEFERLKKLKPVVDTTTEQLEKEMGITPTPEKESA